MDINKIIGIVRSLKEEAPTMSMGAGGIAGSAEAGDEPPVKKKREKKKYIFMKGVRKTWKP
jgi:hypothetical protein|tara:strand:+ start:1226 stop:1408 length:183 start_codon:yes stop_codon:yes gene_type:complete